MTHHVYLWNYQEGISHVIVRLTKVWEKEEYLAMHIMNIGVNLKRMLGGIGGLTPGGKKVISIHGPTEKQHKMGTRLWMEEEHIYI